MADRLRDEQQFELLKSKHIGLGTPETTKHEWITNIKRDTYASMTAHHALAEHYAIATNEPVQLTKHHFIEQMIQPYGPVTDKNSQ